MATFGIHENPGFAAHVLVSRQVDHRGRSTVRDRVQPRLQAGHKIGEVGETQGISYLHGFLRLSVGWAGALATLTPGATR